MVFYALMLLVNVALYSILSLVGFFFAIELRQLIYIILSPLWGLFTLSLLIRRHHDLNQNWFYPLLIIIGIFLFGFINTSLIGPIGGLYSLYLLMAKGSENDNTFGLPDKRNSFFQIIGLKNKEQNESDNKGKKQSISTDFSWLKWWQLDIWLQLDKEGFQKQAKEYETLKITQSARGISFLLLLYSAVVTTGAILLNIITSSAFLDVFILIVLGIFIYKGKRWAMVVAMIFVTFEKLGALIIDYTGAQSFVVTVIISLLWWAICLHTFYLAFKVEGLRAKAKKEIIGATKINTDGREF